MASNEIPGPPRFKNEAEEAEWWFKNPDFILQELQRAKSEGRLGHGSVLRKAAEKQAAKSTTIRLDEGDLTLAKLQAEKKGLRYQTYLKMLIHEALRREETSAETQSTVSR
jgi:predicted DNA binding CopG/RHH family protein